MWLLIEITAIEQMAKKYFQENAAIFVPSFGVLAQICCYDHRTNTQKQLPLDEDGNQ